MLGPELHYHNGLFESAEGLDEAVRNAVRSFYPSIPIGSTVLDVGCGWGGPAALLIAERSCRVRGLNVSSAQVEYCRSRGVDAVLADVECEPLDGRWDVALLMESFSHISDKSSLLGRLRASADRLVMTVNCARVGSPSTFGETMLPCTPEELLAMVEGAGWSIVSTRDRRREAMPTLLHWHTNLRRVCDSRPSGHLGVLWDYLNGALRNPAAWARSFPLIDVVAT